MRAVPARTATSDAIATAGGTGILRTGSGAAAGARRPSGAGREPRPFRFLLAKRPCYDGGVADPLVGEAPRMTDGAALLVDA